VGLIAANCYIQGAPVKTTPQKKFIISVTVTDFSPNLQLSQRRIRATYVAIFAMAYKLQPFEIKSTVFKQTNN